MPKVSVIIPAFNAMPYLPETVESVLQQTFTDFEVLIVNDGSSDYTAQWVSQLVDPRIKLISQVNQGLSGARNTGITHAQGEYIAFLDADDLWEPTKLEKQVHSLEENPTLGLVYTWSTLVDRTGESIGRVFAYCAEGDTWKKLIEENVVGCGSAAMVHRCCFETVGVFDRNLRSAEDWDMWIRIASRYPFAVVKEPLVQYRQHPSNMSKNWQVMEQAFRIVIEKAFQSAPPELLYLKKRSYGYINLCSAWKALQSSEHDYELAIQFRAAAIAHYPRLRFSKEYIRLSLAITLMRSIKPNNYEKTRSLFYSLRRYLSLS
ncbi:glycosyltransferase family 2 protein [Gloeocapsopsis dulcis]|uniref:Glycosyl transferase family A n=1 Tax=Gloeocapsopsis dulcis AAB1 = 1H9 TaxID=1433147 RepID=A0A6N8G0X8_9CHRO|nr:glycosyltransferase family A protein [Gloeocapsopsis dulcis]MUL38749.1 glycosyl transferase family A [Gloeocapsopsis dulcis AAB1 = 1H9]WNN91663.1 glycosyltransferase family A protein [Gloeocapsopsis dulcis]